MVTVLVTHICLVSSNIRLFLLNRARVPSKYAAVRMKVASVGGSTQAGSKPLHALHFHVVQRVVLVVLSATKVQRLKREAVRSLSRHKAPSGGGKTRPWRGNVCSSVANI